MKLKVKRIDAENKPLLDLKIDRFISNKNIRVESISCNNLSAIVLYRDVYNRTEEL